MTLRWLRYDVKEYMILEKPHWFQWGYISRYGSKEPIAWYILICLPSYVMEIPIWRDDRPTMHQRCLFFRECLPSGPGGWKEIKWECWQ